MRGLPAARPLNDPRGAEFRASKRARRPVSRVLSRCLGDGHSSGTSVAGRLARPTRAATRKTRLADRSPPCRPYLVLLPVGFALPSPLPATRCALTAPFHPCPPADPADLSGSAVCFLWHCPWGRPRRPLTGTVFPWSPDFPPPATACAAAKGGHPAVWQLLGMPGRAQRQRPAGSCASRAASSRRVSPSGRPSNRAGRKCR